jgi:hypothetical protein
VIPDAPIGHFRLDLFGGKTGYLVNTRNLCASAAMIQIDYVAQSGKEATQRVKTKAACGAGKRAKGRR